MAPGVRNDGGAGKGGRERERLCGLDQIVALTDDGENGAGERAALERGREVGRPGVEARDCDEAPHCRSAGQGEAALLKADHAGSEGCALAECDDAVVRALQRSARNNT